MNIHWPWANDVCTNFRQKYSIFVWKHMKVSKHNQKDPNNLKSFAWSFLLLRAVYGACYFNSIQAIYHQIVLIRRGFFPFVFMASVNFKQLIEVSERLAIKSKYSYEKSMKLHKQTPEKTFTQTIVWWK